MCFHAEILFECWALVLHHTASLTPADICQLPSSCCLCFFFIPRPCSVCTASPCCQRHYVCHLAPVLEELSSAFNLTLFLNSSLHCCLWSCCSRAHAPNSLYPVTLSKFFFCIHQAALQVSFLPLSTSFTLILMLYLLRMLLLYLSHSIFVEQLAHKSHLIVHIHTEGIFHPWVSGRSLDWGSSVCHQFALFSSTLNTEPYSAVEGQQDKASLLKFSLARDHLHIRPMLFLGINMTQFVSSQWSFGKVDGL